MYGIEETIARNGSTKADIEGGSFTLTADGIRVPIFSGIVGEQIESLYGNAGPLLNDPETRG